MRINCAKIVLVTVLAAALAEWNCQAGLTHQYSFNDPSNPGKDSVGSADATLMNNASIMTGGLFSVPDKSGVLLNNDWYPLSGGEDGDYVTLPNDVLAGAKDVTIEFWADLGGYWWYSGASSRVFDFGDNTVVPGQGRNYLIFTPQSGSFDSRAVFDTGDSNTNAIYPYALLGYHHVVVSVNSTCGFMELFVDGALASHVETSCQVTNIGHQAMWLGRSEWAGDSYLYGCIDEFRIYDRPLSGIEAAADFIAGSDGYDPNPIGILGNLNGVNLMNVGSITENGTTTLTATADFDMATGLDLLNAPGFAFASSDPSVATIDQAGVIKALKPGVTTISATYQNVTASFQLTVNGDSTPSVPLKTETLGYNRFVQVTFSKALDPESAQNPANYTIDQGVTVNRAVLSPDGLVVSLWTSEFDVNSAFTLTINGVKDTAYSPNSIDHATIAFGGIPGGMLVGRYYFASDGYSVNTIQDAMQIPGFPFSGGVVMTCLNPGLSDGIWGQIRTNYVSVIQGWIVAPMDGTYTFAMAADDAAQFYLSADDSESALPTSPTIDQTQWASYRSYLDWYNPTTATVDLVGGKKYFFRVYHLQRNGPDTLDITWQKPGDPDIYNGQPPIEAQYIVPFLVTPRPITITSQPQDLWLEENRDATFSFSVDSWPTYIGVQWYKSNSLGVVAIPGANTLTYTAPMVSLNDNGSTFWAVASNLVDVMSTRVATLSVKQDIIAPQVVAADAGLQIGSTGVTVSFSERMDPISAAQPGNYTIVGPSTATVISAIYDNVTKTNVHLILSDPLIENGLYTVTAYNVKDLAGNMIDRPHSAVDFCSAQWASPGQFVINIYDNYSRTIDDVMNGIAGLTPTRQLVYNNMGTTDIDHGDYFAGVAEGLLTPPETGDYIFVMNSDNGSRLFLSTDESPANLSGSDLCGIDDWTYGLDDWTGGFAATQWGSHPFQSQPITLVKGMRYYYRVTWVENIGYDYLQVGWQTPSNPNTTLIPGTALFSVAAGQPTCPPPRAGVFDLRTPQNTAATVDTTKLIIRAKSGSGGALSVSGVSASSAQGGTVTLTGGIITYVPPQGYVGADSFTYNLFDGVAYGQGKVSVMVTSLKPPASASSSKR